MAKAYQVKHVLQAIEKMENKDESKRGSLHMPFSGKFVVRVPPEVHRELATKAAEEGISLNRLINSKLS